MRNMRKFVYIKESMMDGGGPCSRCNHLSHCENCPYGV